MMGEWVSGSVDCGCHQLSENVWLYGSESIGSDQLDRFRTRRYNHMMMEMENKATSRSVPLGSDKYIKIAFVAVRWPLQNVGDE